MVRTLNIASRQQGLVNFAENMPSRWSMVGGHVGLMGVVADAAMAAGGTVTGLIPERLLKREVGHRAISELIVTENMFDRKDQMIARSDAFAILPGGLGTLDELFEVLTLRQLGYHQKPIVLININGFLGSTACPDRPGRRWSVRRSRHVVAAAYRQERGRCAAGFGYRRSRGRLVT